MSEALTRAQLEQRIANREAELKQQRQDYLDCEKQATALRQEIERLNQLVSEGQEAIGHYQAEVKRYSLCGHDHSTAWWQLRCEQIEQERDEQVRRVQVLIDDNKLMEVNWSQEKARNLEAQQAIARLVAERDQNIEWQNLLKREIQLMREKLAGILKKPVDDVGWSNGLDEVQATFTRVEGEKAALYKERNQLRAMLDRIDAIPEVADGYHAPNEECIADGVEAVVDRLAQAEQERERLTHENARLRERITVLDTTGRLMEIRAERAEAATPPSSPP